MGLTEINGKEYHIDNKLIKMWTNNSLDKMKKRNSDRVYIVDGRERSGKSTWAIQQMGYLDPAAFETPEKMSSRIVFTAEQFHEAVRNTKNGVVIFDEAFRGFSSRAALSRVNKLLIQTLMEMGQNNNIVFIVLPSFFMLDMYPAMLRSDGLFHISEDPKTNLRKFEGYNRKDKNKIYQLGARKGWGYGIKSKFKGRFGSKFPGGEVFKKVYDEKKREAFANKMEDKLSQLESKWKDEMCLTTLKLWEASGMTQKAFAEKEGYSTTTLETRLRHGRQIRENQTPQPTKGIIINEVSKEEISSIKEEKKNNKVQKN